MLFFAPIVEGHGELEAVPALLHRIATAVGHPGEILVNPPIRVKSGSFINDRDYFRKHVMLATGKAASRRGAVIILLDCDDARNCPAVLGPALLKQAQEVRNDVPILVGLAWREYETWLVSAVRSLAGQHGLPAKTMISFPAIQHVRLSNFPPGDKSVQKKRPYELAQDRIIW